MAVDVTKDEEAKGLDVTAHYANKMFIALSSDGVRVTFAEESASKAMQPRCAVFMTNNGFGQFAELVRSLNAQITQPNNISDTAARVPLAAVPEKPVLVN